jgi:ribose 5-phosphate isomerase B
MRIAIASDHAGFEQKQELADFLRLEGHEAIDLGPHNADRVDYPDYAVAVARAVASGVAERGVLVCGTGIGMCIAANKIRGIRAANVTDPAFALLAREHNDANVITLSGRFTPLATNKEILINFIQTPFAGGRHAARVAKITALEA